MVRTPSYPFLVRQGDVLHARLDIPADVRPVFSGKKVFSRSTKHSNPEQAFRRAQPWLDGWRAEIEAARSGTSPVHPEALARQFAAETGRRDIFLIRDLAGFVARRFSHLTEDQWEAALAASDQNPLAALSAIDGPRAVQAVRHITQANTPFASRVAAFQVEHQTNLTSKVIYEYTREIERFESYGEVSVETFSAKHVQHFIETRAKVVANATIRKQVSALSTYWNWLSSTEPTLRDRRPFDGITYPKVAHRRSDPTQADFVVGEHDDGPRFKPEQVCALWEAAHVNGDIDLRDAIVIAAYTGARREGIFTLHLKTTALDEKVPHIHLDEKTEAGERTIPVHPAIAPILSRRFKSPEANGYLFRGASTKSAPVAHG